MKDEATHQPILIEAIRQTKGAIIELGLGYSSTVLIHTIAGDRLVCSIDDNIEWVDKFRYLETDTHQFGVFSENIFEEIGKQFSVALIDLSTWDQRMFAIEKLRHFVDYVIIHDAQDRGLGRFFKYWREYRTNDFPMPTTMLASNKLSLDDIHVEGATIINHG